MAHKKTVGIFFGSNSLSIVEAEKKEVVNFFDAPDSLFDDTQQLSSSNLPDDIKLTAIVQKALRDKRIEEPHIHVSLPTYDIILRSFTIPWMAPSEIKGVVEFEARRYVPFKLEELAYGYYTTPATEQKQKKISILFIAVRRDILAKYCAILEQSGLTIATVEPAPISILRALTLKKRINRQQNYALVQISKSDGTIIIVNKGIPQFIRDFRLSSAGENTEDAAQAKLVNEIRISLDYYRRQHASASVDKILLVSASGNDISAKSIESASGIKTAAVSARSVLGLSEEVNNGVLNAFGSSVRTSFSFPVDINLYAMREKSLATAQPIIEHTPINRAATVKVGAACAAVIALMLMFSRTVIGRQQSTLATLTKTVGIYEALTPQAIAEQEKEIREKINAYKSIRLTSDVALLMSRIPALLPDGAWLKNFSIKYSEAAPSQYRRTANHSRVTQTQLTIDMNGYAYDPNINRQLSLINAFVVNLKENSDITRLCGHIALATVDKKEIDGNTATYFQVKCNQ